MPLQTAPVLESDSAIYINMQKISAIKRALSHFFLVLIIKYTSIAEAREAEIAPWFGFKNTPQSLPITKPI